MTRKEALQTEEMLRSLERLGITRNDAEALRRISMTLHRWHELECGVEHGGVDYDEETGRIGTIATQASGPVCPFPTVAKAPCADWTSSWAGIPACPTTSKATRAVPRSTSSAQGIFSKVPKWTPTTPVASPFTSED